MFNSIIAVGKSEEQNARFRETMEDKSIIIDNFLNDSNSGFFGVFDGHGGILASSIASQQLHKQIIQEVITQIYVEATSTIQRNPYSPIQRMLTQQVVNQYSPLQQMLMKQDIPISNEASSQQQSSQSIQQPQTNQDSKSSSNSKSPTIQIIQDSINTKTPNNQQTKVVQFGETQIFKSPIQQRYLSPKMNQKPVKYTMDQLNDIQTPLYAAFRHIDEQMQQQNCMFVGCTACILLVSEQKLVFANAGDTRAVLCQQGEARRITRDHKAVDEYEQVRIKQAGGGIVMGRVNGFISVSRALGDWCVKKLVIGEPEIFEVMRNNQQEFVIIACDGLWDVISDQQACDIVKQEVNGQVNKQKAAMAAAQQLKDAALLKGSTDNVTIIVVLLKEITK